MTDQRRLNLPLFALGAIAAHAVVITALLPMLITLPGPGSAPRGPLIIDVEMMHAPPATASDTLAPGAVLQIAPPAAPSPAVPSAMGAAADPMTTQSTAPLADAGRANEIPAGEAKDAPTAHLPPGSPPGTAPDTAPAIARAEPPETLFPTKPASSAVTEPAKPKQVEKPVVKKPAAARAKPVTVTPRVHQVAKAKPKARAPASDFNTLFSGTILAPAPSKANGAPDQRATR